MGLVGGSFVSRHARKVTGGEQTAYEFTSRHRASEYQCSFEQATSFLRILTTINQLRLGFEGPPHDLKT
jgi:hypothetical protein